MKKPRATSTATKTLASAKSQTPNTELSKRVEQLSLINSISRTFASTLNMEELLKKVLNKVLDAADAEAGSFWIKDEKTGDNVCELAEGPTKTSVIGVRLENGKGVVGWCVENKKKSVVFNTAKDKRFDKGTDEKSDFRTESMICVPVIVDEQSFGAIQIINKKNPDERFNEDDSELVEALAEHAGIALKNAQLYESEKKVQDLNTILKLSKEITATLDIDSVLLSVVNLTSKMIRYRRGIIALVDEDNIVLGAISEEETIDHDSDNSRALRALLLNLSKGEGDQYIQMDSLENENTSPELTRYLELNSDVQSFWVSPLKDGEGVVGILMFESEKPDFLKKRQLEILSILSNQCTVALRNSLLYSHTPMMKLFNEIEGKKRSILGHFLWGSKKRSLISLSTAVVMSLALLLPLPDNIPGSSEIVPLKKLPVYVKRSGLIINVPNGIKAGAVVEKGEVLATLDSRDLEASIAKNKKELVDLDRQIADYRAKGNITSASETQFKKKKILIDLEQAKVDLENSEILSPSSGTILSSDLAQKQGLLVSAGTAFLDLADESKVQLQLTIKQNDIVRVKENQTVRFTLAGFPYRSFKGQVERILPVGDNTDDNVTFKVRVSMDNASIKDGLLVGMSGSAVIQTSSSPVAFRMLSGLFFKIKKALLF